jgi:hypothetical protein
MAFRDRAVGGREAQGSTARTVCHEANPVVPASKRGDPGHQALWRNFYPTTAACGRILHGAAGDPEVRC